MLGMVNKKEYENLKSELELHKNELVETRRELGNKYKEISELEEELNTKNEGIEKLYKFVNSFSHDFSGELGELKDHVLNEVNEINQGIENQSSYQQQMSTQLEEISQTTSNIAEAVSRANDTSKIDAESTSGLNSDIEVVNNEVINLSNKMKEINNVIETIESFMEKTSLLSLNAQIESARAGEAGRGFAVVANEIKKLSEQTSESSKDIKRIVGEITSEVELILDKTTNVTENSKVLLKNNNERVENIHGLNISIQDLNASLQELSAGAEESSATAQEMAERTNNICNDNHIKANEEAIYIGNQTKTLHGEETLPHGSYHIFEGGGKVLIKFDGVLSGNNKYVEHYNSLKSGINVGKTDLILDARELGIFASESKGKIGVLYKDYATFNHVYVVVGNNNSIKMQLTNMLKELGVLSQYSFVDDYIESNPPKFR